MPDPADPRPARRRRRAVGPPGARPAAEPERGALAPHEAPVPEDDDERLLREVPPHHGD